MIIWDMENQWQIEEDYGYFPKESGNEYVVGDIHTLRRKTEKKYPGIPYFMLGHSMGSFLLRQYLLFYAEGCQAQSLWEQDISITDTDARQRSLQVHCRSQGVALPK